MVDPEIEVLQQQILATYSRFFEPQPLLIRSPGRINLIGEHTDYNDGFVMPASIDKAIVLALSLREDAEIHLHSVDMQPSQVRIDTASSYASCGVQWADYIIGVVDELQKAGHAIPGFNCVFGGNVPIGAGLSSSAALEGGVAYGLNSLLNLNLSRMELAKIAMKAENDFVGVNCGIMDQFASLNGKQGKVLQLDCRSLDFTYLPFEWDEVCVLLCDTKVRRTLAGSEYNIRRQQCEAGVQVIKQSYPFVERLRDVNLQMLEEHKEQLDSVVYRRCRYVVEENNRVKAASEALFERDLSTFGQLMYQSHKGLRDDYEVSCSELDTLVDAAASIPGILGARMMGGGFGGCTINLVKMEDLTAIHSKIAEAYQKMHGKTPTFHVVHISEGTHELSIPNP